MGQPTDRLAALIEALPPELARNALTHASWTDDPLESFERLAFLGDSVLGLAVSARIYPELRSSSAGRLTKVRAHAVSGRSCKRVALVLGLDERLREAAPSSGRGRAVETLLEAERPLASVMEAVIGACYLTHGFEATAEAVAEAFSPEVEFATENVLDFKSALQEALARRGRKVSYEVVAEAGPPHKREFTVEAQVGAEIVGLGHGASKKEAEQEAARQALESVR